MMHDDTKRGITRRSLLLGALGAGLMGIVLTRLGYLQLFKQSYYELLSDENRLSLKVLPPKRGKILDRWGSVLAYNVKSFRAILIPEILEINKTPFNPMLEKLSALLGILPQDIKRILKQKKRNPKFSPLVLKENISWSEVAKLELALLDFPGVQVEETEKRFYPFGEAFAHLIGYIGRISEKEAQENQTQEYTKLLHADVKVGKSGIEKAFDSLLRGSPGLREIEVNARGRYIRDLSQNDPTPGQDLKLTIDLDLQEKLMTEVNAFPSAAAVLMDIGTGDILALGSSPSYNPNLFSDGIPQNVWDELRANPFNPLISKVWGGLYAPGSTFKMCVALAALKKGVIDAKTSVLCSGHITLGNHRFHCWKKEGHGRVTLKEALQRSCDVYFYEVAKRTGVDAIAQMAVRLGIGESSSFNLSGVKHGIVPTKAWKLKRFNQSWQHGETLITGIGQGYVLSTPLELAVMISRLASRGRAITPRIYAEGSPEFESLGIDENHLNLVLSGINATCNEAGGTAYRYRITEPGFFMAGKTGTSQVKRISLLEREQGVKNADLDWRLRHHALFVAYAPVQDPKYAICVLIEHGGDGGLVAVPPAQRLLLAAQKRE